MNYLHTRSNWIAQRVTIFICLPAAWLFTSCDTSNRDATDIRTFEPSINSPVQRFGPHEILVKFKDGVSQERIAFILKANQIEVIVEIQSGYLYHVRILGNRSVESAITRLTSYQEIEYAEPNYRYGTKK